MPKGRPPKNKKYKPEMAVLAGAVAEQFGATNAQLGKLFEVSADTICAWISEYPEFGEAVKKARAVADTQVEKSLYQKATGYSHEAEKIFCNKDGEVTRVPYIERYAPDTTSMIFWLKNRQREDWRDVNRTEVVGAGGAPLPIINITLNTPEGQAHMSPAIDVSQKKALPEK